MTGYPSIIYHSQHRNIEWSLMILVYRDYSAVNSIEFLYPHTYEIYNKQLHLLTFGSCVYKYMTTCSPNKYSVSIFSANHKNIHNNYYAYITHSIQSTESGNWTPCKHFLVFASNSINLHYF